MFKAFIVSLAVNFARHTVLAAAVLSDFSLLCLGSRVFVQFVLIMNLLEVKRLSLGNSIPFYCVLSRVVTTLSRSLRKRKLFV